MTKKEQQRITMQHDTLRSLGFTSGEADQLRRISMTLHRWHELECGDGNGCIERDDTTGKPMWRNSYTGRTSSIADRETGALKRLATIINARNTRAFNAMQHTLELGRVPGLTYYVQGDPRGAALYIIRPGDVPEGKDVEAYYSRGICVH